MESPRWLMWHQEKMWLARRQDDEFPLLCIMICFHDQYPHLMMFSALLNVCTLVNETKKVLKVPAVSICYVPLLLELETRSLPSNSRRKMAVR